MIVFFFNDTATTEIYTLSLHDALPIYPCRGANSQRTISRVSSARRSSHRCSGATWNSPTRRFRCQSSSTTPGIGVSSPASPSRSEEHTSELQSRQYLVCRLLLEKKKHR